MRNKLGTICMGLGAVLILMALSLFFWNQQQDRQAGEASAVVLPQLRQHIAQPEVKPAADPEPEDLPSLPDPFDPTMTEVEIDGLAYIGTLSIPTLELELPVLSAWDEQRLRIAPCRYAGSTKTGDLVIAGHNYRQHFGRLSSLSVGDAVSFEDMDGVCRAYEVAAVETLGPDAVEQMTSGEYDLTLFTCTYDGSLRVTIRCEQTE